MSSNRLFKGTVDYYAKYRSAYPAELIVWVVERCNLSNSSRVLDLGSGPGLLAKAFAPFVGEVVAVDPEPRMLEAAKDYLGRYAHKVRLVQAAAHELSTNLGEFSLVAIGRAFHWMDREHTLKLLEELTTKSATVALFRDPALKLPENGWRAAYDELFTEYASSEAARLGAQPCSIAIDEEHLLSSAFNYLERISLVQRRKLSVEHLLGRAYSMAGTSPDDLGSRRTEFEDAMRRALLQFAPTGVLEEITEPQALLAHRHPQKGRQ